jgi:hypothetical protein
MERRHHNPGIRGDAAILYTFFTLMIVISSALVIGTLVTTTIQRSRDISVTTQAFYAADTGVERGYFAYAWDANGAGDPPTCIGLTDVPVPGGVNLRYDVTVSGDPWPTGSCPTLADLAAGRALCVTAVGEAKNGTVQRKIESDTDAVTCGR